MTQTLSNPILDDPQLLADLERIWSEGQAQVDELEQARLAPPLVRLWDGDWLLRTRIAGEISAHFQWKLNETGVATVVLPFDHHVVEWVIGWRMRKRNVHITCDKDGARWGGRLNRLVVTRTDSGDRELRMEFLHDYEELKHVLVWSNPVLPAAVQFPRAFTLAGPSIWSLKTALFLNLMRNQNSLFTLPDDPLDFSQWTGNLNMANWPIAMRGGSFLGDSSPHAIISSRFKTFHDLAAPILADAQLMVTCQRWLEGDPEPWPGYTPRNGQLIVDIVDKSGWFGATGTGGNILQGILRTVMQLGDDLVDSDRSIVSDPNVVPERGDWLGTAPSNPWIVLRDGDVTGIESSEFSWQPATDVQVVVGGHSMPFVNELISSAVQLAGDLASSTFIGPNVNLGQVADTLLAPLYTDTLLAWMAVKSFVRAQEAGWSHYFERMPTGADRAYTLSSLMALRRGFWETRERVGHKLKVRDGAPYLIGENGMGHYWLGDRIASTIPGLPAGELIVDQVTVLDLGWDRPTPPGWDVTVGDLHATESGLDQIVRQVAGAVEAAKTLGVM